LKLKTKRQENGNFACNEKGTFEIIMADALTGFVRGLGLFLMGRFRHGRWLLMRTDSLLALSGLSLLNRLFTLLIHLEVFKFFVII